MLKHLLSAAFVCAVRGGALQPDGEEALEARFFAWDEIDGLDLSSFTSELLHAVRQRLATQNL